MNRTHTTSSRTAGIFSPRCKDTLPDRKSGESVQLGFSLIEILVGLGIGMLGIVIMMQVFSVSEGQKRTTTGGADASTNGAVAMDFIQRDVRMVGWGLDPSLYFGKPAVAAPPTPAEPGCQSLQTYCDGDASCGGTAGPLANFTFAPVIIADGGASASDAITVRFFADPSDNAYAYPSYTSIISGDGGGNPKDNLPVNSNFGCKKGSLALVSDKNAGTGTCTLIQVTDLPDATHLEHKQGVANGHYNKNTNWSVALSGKLMCFEPVQTGNNNLISPFHERTYEVDPNTRQLRLTRDNISQIYEPLVSGSCKTGCLVSDIMVMKAEYGYASIAGSQKVDKWTKATAPWDKPSIDDLKKIKAVRVVLLARSSQYEKPKAGTCDATTAAMTATWPTYKSTGAPMFNTGNSTLFPTGWDCYRYKVFDDIIPLRNVIWAGI